MLSGLENPNHQLQVKFIYIEDKIYLLLLILIKIYTLINNIFSKIMRQ
jgi:hypothetical protein